MDKNQEHYRDLMYDIIETNSRYVVVEGIGDVVWNTTWQNMEFSKKQGENWFWFWCGYCEVESELLELELDTQGDPQGEYGFRAIFRKTYDEGPLLEHIELTFLQTFEQRHRENALGSLFGEPELGDLFDI